MFKRYFLFVVLVAFVAIVVYKFAFASSKYGYPLTTDEVRGACGQPQNNEPFKLIYDDNVRRVEFRFMSVAHRSYLNHIQWSLKQGGAGDIFVVDKSGINDAIAHQYLPGCLGAIVN